jgi:hypothetical protein
MRFEEWFRRSERRRRALHAFGDPRDISASGTMLSGRSRSGGTALAAPRYQGATGDSCLGFDGYTGDQVTGHLKC